MSHGNGNSICGTYLHNSYLHGGECDHSRNGIRQQGAAAAPAAPASELTPEKRREMIAAVSAALAEELGKDVSAIKITSFKKI